MKITALTVILLTMSGAAFAQAPTTTPTASTGKPLATMFLHQTLGESWDDFMRISGAKMNPCGSQTPESVQWCESFKKAEAGGRAEIKVRNDTISASLVFSQKKLMKVVINGKADFSKSVVEFTQTYGAPDSQTPNSANWFFADGGGIILAVKPSNEAIATYYCKDAKAEVQTERAVQDVAAQVTQASPMTQPAQPTAFRNFVLGATFNDMVSAGIIHAEMCEGKVQREMKKGCKDLEKARSGQFVAVTIQADSTGRVVLNFEGSKLIAVRIEPSYSTSFELQLLELTKKYGKPTTVNSTTMQNGYGATWDQGYASWKMPDGAEIDEMEIVVSGSRSVHVDFKCKELAEKERAAFAAKQMTY